MEKHELLAAFARKKRQVRLPISRANTFCNGNSWNAGHYSRARWDMAFVDPGPSPAGNAGPYLHVSWPQGNDQIGARVYPRFEIGDRLVVREDWHLPASMDGLNAEAIKQNCLEAGYRSAWAPVTFAADGSKRNWEEQFELGRPRDARHMPKWLSRFSPMITEIRIERLRSISMEDLAAEAAEWIDPAIDTLGMPEDDVTSFGTLLGFMSTWDRIHANPNHKWAANPWVIALTFVP